MANVQEIYASALRALNARDLKQAEHLFKQVLSEEPDHVPALNMLTIVLMSAGKLAEAETQIARAVRLNPNSDVSFYNYGSILKQLGRPADAVDQFGEAIALNASVPETWNNRGTAYSDLKRYGEALADFDKAIELNGSYAEAYSNKGKALCELRRRDDALRAFDKALALKPDLAEAWVGRGNVRADVADYEGGLSAYDRAARIRPDLAQAWLGRANALGFLRRFDDALAAYDRTLSLKPDLADAWLARGNLLGYLRRYDDAVASYDRAVALDPDLPELAGNRFFCKMQLCDWGGYEAAREDLLRSMRTRQKAVTPFIAISFVDDPQEQRDYASVWASNYEGSPRTPVGYGRKAGKIRLAYLSADFRTHPVSYLMAGVFENHDRDRFETTAISLGHDDGSRVRARLTQSFDAFIDANGHADGEVIQIIKDRNIDILVDLMGYTEGARTRVLAARPAPVQVNYLGFPGTMGADFIDYIILDRAIAPQSHRRFYREKIAYLPRSYMPNDDVGRRVSGREFTRAEFGLPEDAFVFCCFNNMYKINPSIFRLWMRIMAAAEHSVLWLSAMHERAKENLRNEAREAGIDPQRLAFATRVESSEDHLARHRLADLFLDTFPYNAHTTASDALLAGLPVLTRAGDTFASRVAASLLSDLDLAELIASSEGDYAALAIDLARNRHKLRHIKAKLAANSAPSKLFDTKAFTRDLEAVYRAMYDRHYSGLPPDHIEIERAQ